MGAAVSITRLDLTASELRRAASGEKDSAAARRILALALVLDGVGRKTAVSTTIQPMSRQRSLIAQQHRPIRRHPPAGLGLRQGRRERWVNRLRYVKLQACNCRIVVLA